MLSGVNCSIHGCHVSRRSKYRGVSIFKVPSGDSEFETAWRNKLIDVLTKDRVIDSSLREQINKRTIRICQQHFRPDQYNIHDTSKTLKPGEIPELILPVKSIPSKQSTPRSSAESISIKKEINLPPPSSSSNIVSPCYRDFEEFKKLIKLIKLPLSWKIVNNYNVDIVFKYFDSVHTLAMYEVFTNDTLIFKIRYFLWLIPNNHEIYTNYSHSFNNITVSNLVKVLSNYNMCSGINDPAAAVSFIEHSVLIIFTLSSADANTSPLYQSKFCRHPSCTVLLPTDCSTFSFILEGCWYTRG